MSRKSFWRRQTKSIQRGDEHDFLYREGVRDVGMNIPTRSQSLPSVGTALLTVTGLGHVWATMSNLAPDTVQTKSPSSSCVGVRPRRITFLPTVRVVLIPARTEYQEGGMASDLWWEECDYSTFKNSAIRELKALMALKHLNSKAAQQVLYQPGFHLELELDVDINRQSSKASKTEPSSSPQSSSGSEEPCSMDASPIDSDTGGKSDSVASKASTRPLAKSTSTPNLGSFSATLPSPLSSPRGDPAHPTTPPSPTAADMGLIGARTDVDLNKMHPHLPQHSTPPISAASQHQIEKDRSLHPLALLVQ